MTTPLSFDEEIFVWALATRSADARKFRNIFRSDWLETVELIPILDEIYSFVQEHTISPSLATLEKIFKEKDETIFTVRIKPTLDKLKALAPDQSEVLFVLSKAKDIAVIRSFNALFRDERIIEAVQKVEGKQLLEELHKWMIHFTDGATDQTLNIREALDHLVSTSINVRLREKLACGINCLDKWSGGGLRPPQLGIIMAPTGGGKSAILMNMAYKMSLIENTPVWFVTNELDMIEQTERFLARISGSTMFEIQSDPTIAYAKTIKHWNTDFSENLRITDIGLSKNTSTDDLEAIMNRWANLSGWLPRVLVLDYMGRMCPAEKGYKRDAEWAWYGGIAGDLIKFAKKYNIAVWTACQTNRSGLNPKGDMDMSMSQASIRHFQEASLVVAAQRVKVVGDLQSPNEKSFAIQFKPLKARHAGLENDHSTVHVNLSTMLVTNNEVEAASLASSPADTATDGTNAFSSKLKAKKDNDI